LPSARIIIGASLSWLARVEGGDLLVAEVDRAEQPRGFFKTLALHLPQAGLGGMGEILDRHGRFLGDGKESGGKEDGEDVLHDGLVGQDA
jgi:hypothetical protein